MALTGMQIYKLLPKTNCKDCGFPTCMAFAMQVAAKQKALTDCPHLSQEALEEASEASSPPMRLVKIGPHRPTGIALRIPASLSDDDAMKKLELVNKSAFERVGDTLKVELAAIELDGVQDAAGRAKSAAQKSSVPLILIGTNAAAMKAACEAVKDVRPLIYRADASNIEQFAEIAASLKRGRYYSVFRY